LIGEQQIYERIGEEGFEKLVHAFYKQIPQDDILGPMYPADDLVGRFGGPPRYVEQRGHPRLRMRHAPFPVDRAARDRWMQLMTKALDEAELPADVSKMLLEFFDGVATFMMNRE
jgi:hemoglobin